MFDPVEIYKSWQKDLDVIKVLGLSENMNRLSLIFWDGDFSKANTIFVRFVTFAMNYPQNKKMPQNAQIIIY